MAVLGAKGNQKKISKLFSRGRKCFRGSIANFKLDLKKHSRKQYIFLLVLIFYFSSNRLRIRYQGYEERHQLDALPKTTSDAFIVCHTENPCCSESYHNSLNSMRNQTLRFNSVTILHGCPDSNQLSSDLSEVKYGFNNLREAKCDYDNLHDCILFNLNQIKNESNSHTGFPSILVLESTNILYPTAHETARLYAELRPNLAAVKLLGQFSKKKSTGTSFSEHIFISNSRIHLLPLLINLRNFVMDNSSTHTNSSIPSGSRIENSLTFFKLLRNSRLMREPLYYLEKNFTDSKLSISTNDREIWKLAESRNLGKSYMFSDESYFRWSSRRVHNERFQDFLDEVDNEKVVDTKKIGNARELQRASGHKKSIMFFVPFLQVGGSEKCVFDLAKHAVSMDWEVSIMLTMPFWAVDDFGEVYAKNEWMNRARTITPHVFDIVQISPYDYFAKLLRYFLESRKPDYIFVANSATTYEHLEFIKTVSPGSLVVDYNHMIHWDWEPKYGFGTGGLPRFGTYFTKYIHLHFTASDNVSSNMKKWIDSTPGGVNPDKVQTCYIGTEIEESDDIENRDLIRENVRSQYGIESDKIVFLFIGRLVRDKGVDVLSKSLKIIASNKEASKKFSFLIVGSGPLEKELINAKEKIGDSALQVIIEQPTNDEKRLRSIYAASDILLLPSRNEGIALVIYEAMASGLLVMSTDVGGQAEILNSETGVLLPRLDSLNHPEKWLAEKLVNVSNVFKSFDSIRENARNMVRNSYNKKKFSDCVFDSMEEKRNLLQLQHYNLSVSDTKLSSVSKELVSVARWQKVDSQWNLDLMNRPIEDLVTIGIKTYVCDTSITKQLLNLLRSIRTTYPYVRLLIANDGPLHISGIDFIKNDDNIEEVRLQHDAGISYGRNLMVSMTKTEYFVLLDDDHVFDFQTDLKKAISGLKKGRFDIVGFRVYNLPGIYEMEAQSIFIPRYVALVSEFKNRRVRLCVWNENLGPGVSGMKVPIKVDVLHNALIARTDILQEFGWRNELKVNEHLTFFLDAREAGLNVGYLPSVFIHHQAREYSKCYKSVRFREDEYEALLDYEDKLLWDTDCGDDFPNRVRRHLNSTAGL